MAMPEPEPWVGGWHPSARKSNSPNFGARPPHALVDLIVIHSISLPPGQYGGREVEQLFSNQLDWEAHPYFQKIRGIEVSAHFLIRRDGELVQFVSVLDRAWHAGLSSFQGRSNCNDFSIGIELEGLEGDTFEDKQYAALVGLCSDLRSHLPIQHVAGHEEIAPGRKRDPGPGFDWEWLHGQLPWTRRCFPE
jgi:N-acetyl-anhydromuramoyl-L-alanine amidase